MWTAQKPVVPAQMWVERRLVRTPPAPLISTDPNPHAHMTHALMRSLWPTLRRSAEGTAEGTQAEHTRVRGALASFR
jgi:hypothetical protein